MTDTPTRAMEVARLAVVSEDFTTYYIPRHTIVHGKHVARILERSEHYEVVDIDNVILAEVSKKAPIVVDWKETSHYELEMDDQLEYHLIAFGNFLFERYEVQVMNTKGEPYAIRQVDDADLSNWKDVLIENTKSKNNDH